jgi:hypothetical protein
MPWDVRGLQGRWRWRRRRRSLCNSCVELGRWWYHSWSRHVRPLASKA